VALALGLGVWLIPRFGAVGAAWSMLGVKVLMTLLSGAALYLALRPSGAPR
jgi:hypothetical protein